MTMETHPGAKPLHVAYILRKFPVLSETFVLNEMLALEAQGVKIHIFALDRPNDPRFHENLPRLKAEVRYAPSGDDWDSIRKYHAKAAKAFGSRYYKALFYALRHFNRELLWRMTQACYVANYCLSLGVGHLHSHFANRPTTVAMFVSQMTGIPYSFTAHAADLFRKKARPSVLAKKMQDAKFVVAISQFNKQFLSGLREGLDEKIIHLYNGIDLQKFTPNGRLYSSPHPFRILCVSRLVEKKGLPVLIKACRYLRDRKISFDCQIAGTGILRSYLERLILRWDLSQHVTLLGPLTQHEVLEHYQKADIYVLPCVQGSDGNREGLPVSIVEALACGVPVITTSMTGIPEVVRDRHNGLFVPEEDARAIANAVQLLIKDKVLYDELRSRARASVVGLFDLNHSSRTLRRLFEESRP